MKKTYIIPASRVHHFTTSGIIAASPVLSVYTDSEKKADGSDQLVREETQWKNDIFEEVW